MSSSLLVVIPTRNRSDLAANAIRSIIDQPHNQLSVLVSDNSTKENEISSLANYCSSVAGRDVDYVRPPTPLSMQKHWEWAMDEALRRSPSQVAYLTDRMIIRKGELAPLLELAGRYQDEIVVYKDDAVYDDEMPVRLHLARWSGKVVRLRTETLLNNASKMKFVGLPRMLNCIVPVSILESVKQRFDSCFGSTNPDFCFAFRSLAVVRSLLYFDRSPLLNYARDRSVGGSVSRGEVAEDQEDFLRNLDYQLNSSSPVPKFRTLRNGIIDEYCRVRQETRNPKFPEVDRDCYLSEIAREIRWMRNQETKREMLELLSSQGRFRWRRPPAEKVRDLLRRAAGPRLGTVWVTLSRWLRIYPPGDATLGFESREAALEHANSNPRRRHRFPLHLRAHFGRFETVETI